ncbi:hypothetical protein NM688_g3073 [Phlebia brevispora]|uniref:Uncharacterized protein n=1 Tax=Phlebia brevispora TaxID=194682 RepID=A0ACC1T6Q2_9APHY|nr:hypothetical protein NM688_g3073 [Phlebia brevispora]
MEAIDSFSKIAEKLDARVVLPLASVVTWLIYKKYEPTGLKSSTLLLLVVPGLLSGALRTHFPTLLHTVAVVYIRYWTLLTLLIVAYRISPFHPLAAYPGPLLCKVSKLWHAYIVWRYGKSFRYVQELHEQYGEIVRIGPNELSVCHKDIATAVLGPKGLPRGPYYDTREHEEGVSLDGLRDMTVHTSRRRPWARGMNSTAMKYYEGLIKSTVDDLLAGLHKRGGQKLDISAWMTFFGFDFMGHMAFSYDYRMLKEGRDESGLAHMIERALIDAAWLSHIPWAIPFAKTFGGSSAWDEIKVVGETTVKRRIDAGFQHPDLFHHLLDEGGSEPERPSLVTAAIDGQLAIIAGSDTAATTLAHLWYFLLTNPLCFKLLRKEVDETFPHGEDAASDLAKQSAMPYLNACINETLRLYPPVLTGLQRRVIAGSGGKMIGPYFVPEETQVSLWAYSIQRDPQHYSPLPNTFWPERWLVQEQYTLPSGDTITQEQVHTNRDVFMPFSQGPMVCAGKNVALAEMRAVVCAVMQQFDFEIADKAPFETWEDDIALDEVVGIVHSGSKAKGVGRFILPVANTLYLYTRLPLKTDVAALYGIVFCIAAAASGKNVGQGGKDNEKRQRAVSDQNHAAAIAAHPLLPIFRQYTRD